MAKYFKKDLFILLVVLLVAVVISLLLKPVFLVTIVLFFVLPSIYITCVLEKRIFILFGVALFVGI
jgi:hypothetical protein